MKKKLIYVGCFVLFIFLFFKNCGFQIGDIRIGKQNDFIIKQDSIINNSAFYRDYYAKEKLVVLNLWATWCKPCVAEIPELNKIKSKYDNNVEFVSFSVDTDSIKLRAFLNTKKFHFNDVTFENLKFKKAIINTLDNRKTNSWISSYSVPVTYLIKNKKVLIKIDGSIEKGELENLIEKYK